MKTHLSITWRILLTIVLAFGMAGVPLHSARAVVVCSVVSGADSGPGTLRLQMNDSGCDYIEIGYWITINLASPLPDVNRTVSINDAGKQATINGNGLYQIFHVTSSGSLSLYNTTIMNGYSSGPGGGILNEGSLYLKDDIFSGNKADLGGAIENSGAHWKYTQAPLPATQPVPVMAEPSRIVEETLLYTTAPSKVTAQRVMGALSIASVL